jgi:hypothetical protein
MENRKEIPKKGFQFQSVIALPGVWMKDLQFASPSSFGLMTIKLSVNVSYTQELAIKILIELM